MEKDMLAKTYFSDDTRYADLINGLGFQGRQVVKKEDLQEMDTQTGMWKTATAKRGRAPRMRTRDLIRKTAFGVNFALIGIENQEITDYALPLRTMEYDVGEYGHQASVIRKELRRGENRVALSPGEYLYGFAKDSKLYPTVTFVLYYGKEAWDGATDLYGILDFTGIPEEVKELVQNYKVHVIDVRKIADTSVFRTDIRQVFDLLRYAEEPEALKKLVEEEESYRDMEEDAYDFVAAYTDTEGLVEMKKWHKKGEKVNMCGAIAALVAEGEQKGMERGIEQGMERGIEQGIERGIEQGIERGIAQGMERGITQGIEQERERGIKNLIEVYGELSYSHEDICGKVKEKYTLTDTEARNFVEKYGKK